MTRLDRAARALAEAVDAMTAPKGRMDQCAACGLWGPNSAEHEPTCPLRVYREAKAAAKKGAKKRC